MEEQFQALFLKDMAKKTVHVGGGEGGGILKKRIIKRPKNKKKTIHKVIDYLLSDCYLFAPLISPSPYNSSRPPTKGIEIRESTKHNRSFLRKIEVYLKSDCYMYASLLAPQSLKGCSVGYVKKLTTKVLTTAIMTKEKRICTTDFVDQPNATPKESSKGAMVSNCPSLSISGERMRLRDPKMRKIVKD